MSSDNHRLKFYEIIKTFKEQISELLNDTSLELDDKQRRDNIRKLDNLYDKLMLAKSTNSRLPIELFYRSVVVPYGHYIINQDEKFFLQSDEFVDGNAGDIPMNVLVNEIRFIWGMLDNNNKKIMWKYVLALCIICDKVVGENFIEQLKQMKATA